MQSLKCTIEMVHYGIVLLDTLDPESGPDRTHSKPSTLFLCYQGWKKTTIKRVDMVKLEKGNMMDVQGKGISHWYYKLAKLVKCNCSRKVCNENWGQKFSWLLLEPDSISSHLIDNENVKMGDCHRFLVWCQRCIWNYDKSVFHHKDMCLTRPTNIFICKYICKLNIMYPWTMGVVINNLHPESTFVTSDVTRCGTVFHDIHVFLNTCWGNSPKS